MSRILSLPLLLAIVCFSLSASAAVNTSPSADTMVISADPNHNFGGAGAFGVAAPGKAKGEFQSLMRFDLATAKATFDGLYGVGGWVLSSASLQLTAANPGNPIFNSPSAAGQIAASWMQNDTWAEGTGTPAGAATDGVTFSTLPSFLSGNDQSLGSFAFLGGTSGTSIYPLTLSAGLKADAAVGGLASIRLITAAGDSGLAALFNSRSNGNVANHPALILDAVAVPEPSACLLAAFGMFAIMGLSRQRVSEC